jgi:hypothetical protein
MEIASLIISIIALSVLGYLTVLGWWRQRTVYDIERILFFREHQIDKQNNNNKLKEKLTSGHYTILYTNEYNGYIELILGKIKKS